MILRDSPFYSSSFPLRTPIAQGFGRYLGWGLCALGLSAGTLFGQAPTEAPVLKEAPNWAQTISAAWTSTTYQDHPLSGLALGYGYHFGLSKDWRIGLIGNLCLFQPRSGEEFMPYTYAIHYGVVPEYRFGNSQRHQHRVGVGLGASLNSIRLERQKIDGVYSHVSVRYGYEWTLRSGLRLGPSATYYFYPSRPKTNGDLLLGLSLGFDHL